MGPTMNIKRFPIMMIALMAIVATASATAPAGPAEAQGGPRVDAIVMFDDAPGPAEEAQVRAAGGVITQRYQVLPILAVSLPEGAMAGLSHRPNVVSVQKERDDLRFHDHGTTEVGQELQWGANRIDSEIANANTYKGYGAVVAVLDTGIDTNHPEFNDEGGRIDSRAMSFAGRNPTPNVTDKHGHGTHTAGSIGAGDNGYGSVGVATDVTILPIQIAKGSRIKDSAILAAYEYLLLLDDLPDVVNMSYGGGSLSNAEETALDALAAAGVTLVASAGNSSGGAVGYPASLPSVLAISSTTVDDTLSSFSSVGSQVAFAAPGSNVYSTYKDGLYAHMSGTSMAAPHVAGVAAGGGSLLAEDIHLASHEQGAGLIDASASVGAGAGDGPGNRAPSVNAGPDQTMEFGSGAVSLNGTASDPDGDDLTLLWTVISGTGGFSDGSVADPQFTPSAIGTHTLQFKATETNSGGLIATDTVTITALDPNAETALYGVQAVDGQRKSKGRFQDVAFTVVIGTGSSFVEGAVVTADIWRADRTFAGLLGTTNANGEVVFTIKRALAETYTILIKNVTHSDAALRWDGVTVETAEDTPYP